MGACAKEFIDQLAKAGQSYWQILPINYPDYSASPYSALSAFAGNPYLISPESLFQKGLIQASDLATAQEACKQCDQLDFDLVKQVKSSLLKKAFESFSAQTPSAEFQVFLEQEKFWIEGFALYKSLVNHLGEKWWQWPEQFRDYQQVKQNTLETLGAELKCDLLSEVQFHKWLQYEFHQQWHELKAYAHQHSVQMIGDIPIFVSRRSQDVWAWKDGFQVDAKGNLKSEAGVPPDQFSQDGQKWSMPTYNWEEHHQSDFKWWRERIKKQFEFYDLVRLDHFVGFHQLFNIPPNDQTAANGKWLPTPGDKMLNYFIKDFKDQHQSQQGCPFIAEDLGEVTQEVHALRDKYQIPSMKVMQFGYWEDQPNEHHPYTIKPDAVYYTGTHDTSTLKGWLNQCSDDEKRRIEGFFKKSLKDINQFDFIQCLFSTPASITILPIQDLFYLNDEHRFNIPGTEGKNWIWRIKQSELYEQQNVWEQLSQLTQAAGRKN